MNYFYDALKAISNLKTQNKYTLMNAFNAELKGYDSDEMEDLFNDMDSAMEYLEYINYDKGNINTFYQLLKNVFNLTKVKGYSLKSSFCIEFSGCKTEAMGLMTMDFYSLIKVLTKRYSYV